MKTTVEISKYPLDANYEPPILDFIERLKSVPSIKVKTNFTSTHVIGDYDEVMQLLNREMKLSFEKYGKVIFVMKVLHGELDL